MKEIPVVMTRKEVQDILRVSKGTVLNLIQTGTLDAFKIGNSYRITRDALQEFIRYSEFEKF